MTGDCHVRICGSRGLRCPRPPDRRVLVPAGRLLITTPAHGRLRLLLGGIERYSEPLGDHLHLYTRRSLRDLDGPVGFGDLEITSAGGAPQLRRAQLARAVR